MRSARGQFLSAPPGPAGGIARPRARRRGTILIVTIWIVLVLAALVLMLAGTMRVEVVCSANGVAALQAQAVEMGAIQYVLAHVDSLYGQVPSEQDTPCEAVQVGQGAFWILCPNFDDDQAFTYGIVDEASKLNLNTATASAMLMLTDMTEELAGCIVDWRDTDANVSSNGAESEYYSILADPYQCKDAPLETLEELFLVKGATAQILFGEDVNRNNVLDINEDDGDDSDPPDNRDGHLDRGIHPFVTVYSQEQNTDSNGDPRINVNDANRANAQALASLLQETLPADKAAAVQASLRRLRPFRNSLDFAARTGLTPEEFQPIADRLTTSDPNGTLRGLINVTTAPKEVLTCLPGLEEADVSALLAQRAETGVDLTSIAWVAQALTPEKVAAIGSLITARSYRFSADIVSVSGDGRAFRRCRIVVDSQNSPPRVIYRQDLTHLGWPLAPEILEGLRAGQTLDQVVPARTIVQENR